MQAHVGFGLQDRRHFVDHFQNDVSQIVGHVKSLCPQAGQGDQLSEPGSDSLVAVADHGIVCRVGVNPEAFQDFLGPFPVHAVADGSFIVGVQILVHPAEGNARTGIIFVCHDQHVVDPECLYGLPECCCRFPGNATQVSRHGSQLCSALRVRLALREGFAQCFVF